MLRSEAALAHKSSNISPDIYQQEQKLICIQASANDIHTSSMRCGCIPDILIVYASALSAEMAVCCTGSVIMESPPPAQPMKILPQSSVSRFSSVLPAMYSSYWQH